MINEKFELKENEILEVKSDRLFHDLFNEHEMKTIEWIVMQILNLSYNKIHGKVSVGNISLSNISKDDKEKFVDLEDYLLKIINVNLTKYQDICYNKYEGVDKLSKLLTINDKKELESFTNNEDMLVDYYNKMDRLSKDKEYCRMIWDERIERNLRKAEEYYNGTQDGIEQGIMKKQQEMINNMYQDNLPIETISKYANLSIDEVKSIIENNK